MSRNIITKSKYHPTSNSPIRGFTVVELIVVIAVMAILIILTLSYALSLQESGRDTARKNDINNLKDSLEAHYNDRRSYPDALGNLVPTYYLDQIPVDPQTGDDYTYEPAPEGCTTAARDCTSYSLSANLENNNDEAATDGLYVVESLE